MATAPETRSLRFKEWMSGHVDFDNRDDLVVVNDDGNGWTRLALAMNMHIDDVDAFWRGARIGTLGGTVLCDALSNEVGDELPIHAGYFQLMVLAPGKDHAHMNYLIEFEDAKGRRLTLQGYKEVAPGDFGPWEETTTTLSHVYHDWHTDPDETDLEARHSRLQELLNSSLPHAAASGVLRIRLRDFIRQEFTFRADPDATLGTRLRTRVTFAGKFVASLWRWFGLGHRRPSGPAE
jgi:hypothetical protein